MRSKLITALTEDSQGSGTKRFRDHLRAALELVKKEGDQEKVLTALPGIYVAESKRQKQVLVESLAATCQSGLDVVVKTVSVLTFFLDALTSSEISDEDPDYWVDDLVEDGAIHEEERSVLNSLVEALRERILPEIKPTAMRQEAEGGVLPAFAGCGFTVEVRSVSEDFYRRGTDLSKFKPKVVGHATIASFHIALDVGQPSDFYFQTCLDDIEYLIKMLTAAKMEMAAFEEHLTLSRITETD